MEFDRENIRTKEELIKLIKKLSESDTTKWENVSTANFLEALGAWLEDAEGFYNNANLEISLEDPSWQLFADALQAATVYE